MSRERPSTSNISMMDRLRETAAARGICVHGRAQYELDDAGFDADGVCELLRECQNSELHKNEPDKDPNRPFRILELRIPLDDGDYYVKVALKLPRLSTGILLSFRPWGQ